MSQDSKIPNIKNFDPLRKLKKSEIDFMKLIEEQNLDRVRKLKLTRRNNILTGKIQLIRHENFIIIFVIAPHFSILSWRKCFRYLRIFHVRSAAREILGRL